MVECLYTVLVAWCMRNHSVNVTLRLKTDIVSRDEKKWRVPFDRTLVVNVLGSLAASIKLFVLFWMSGRIIKLVSFEIVY